MKIGLVIYGSLETVSGGYLYDRKLVEFLRERGDTVTLISLPWRNYARHLFDNIDQTWWRSCDLRAIDVLLEDELNHPSLIAFNRRMRGSIPIVSIVHHLRVSEHRPAWQNNIYCGIERAYLSTVDGFVFNSQTTRASVEQLLGQAVAGVVATPAGDRFSPRISAELIAARAHEQGSLRVVFLGNVIARKAPHLLVQAMAVGGGDWTLTIIGSEAVEPGYAHMIRELSSALGVVTRIRWLGNATDRQVADELASHHILAVPSSYEGFGIVYLEAMSFGLPVIAGTLGAAREIITPEVNGFLVAPGAAKDLANKLGELEHDRAKLASMGMQARTFFDHQPTWHDSMSRILAYLTSFLSGSQRSLQGPSRNF